MGNKALFNICEYSVWWMVNDWFSMTAILLIEANVLILLHH